MINFVAMSAYRLFESVPFLAMLALISCARQRPATDPFPNPLTTESEWITYEGIIPNDRGQDVHVELQLMRAAPGVDSWYKIHESLSDPNDPYSIHIGVNSQGTYSVLMGSPGTNIIKINDRFLVGSVTRGKPYGIRDHVKKDLILMTNGDDELIFTDDDLHPVDARYKLIRRSELFTIEGYFTVYRDTSEYFERNTRKDWAVAQFGEYDEAVKNYHSLATEMHEGVYLKALAYSIRRKDIEGREIDALVFKRILDMDTTRSIY